MASKGGMGMKRQYVRPYLIKRGLISAVTAKPLDSGARR
jgi:hypothetical protein